MMQNRTHTCGELRLSDAGKQVKISGWMENVRVVSANLAFVVVRDFYGTTQVVAETEDMVNTFKAITKESTISVEGVVRERDSKTDKMATGDIEIVPAKVEVLGRCQHREEEHHPAVQRGGRPAEVHDRARLFGDHHAHSDGLLPRGRP